MIHRLTFAANLMFAFQLGAADAANVDDALVKELDAVLGMRATVHHTQAGGESYIQVQIHNDTDGALRALVRARPEAVKAVESLVIEKPARDADVLLLAGRLPSLRILWVGDNVWTHALSDVVARSASITEIFAENAGIEGEDLRKIAKAGQIEVLMIGRNRFKGSDVECLRALSKLTQLSISNMAIQSKDVEFLSKLDKLVWIQLINTQVDDDVVPILSKCRQLHIVALVGTKVTLAGGEKLAAALPNAIVSTGEQ